MRKLAVLLSVFVACNASPSGPAPTSERAMHVLFVGNSLTYVNDLPGMLRALGESTGTRLDAQAVAKPNFGLLDHWADGEARASIARGGWDLVILQQGPSSLASSRAELLDYAGRFATEIRAAGAQPALYAVWPEKARIGVFDQVSESYRLAAQHVQGVYLPAGEGWRAAWRRDSTVVLYGADDFHPSLLGSYLAALVLYGRIAGQTPLGLPRSLRTAAGVQVTMTAAQAQLLQEAAAEADSTQPAQP